MQMGCRWGADGMQMGCREDADGTVVALRSVPTVSHHTIGSVKNFQLCRRELTGSAPGTDPASDPAVVLQFGKVCRNAFDGLDWP